MAINFNNQNRGIGTLDLSEYGLQQPEENMTVAEVFNTPQSLMEIGAVEPGTMYGYNLTDQGEVLEDFRNSAVKMRNAPASPTYNQDVQSQLNRMLGMPGLAGDVIKNKDFIQDAINKGFLKTPEDFKNQKSFADPDDLQAMAISNYDQLFGPRTMTDANQSLYTGMMDQSGTPINYTDRIRQQNLPGFASQPQYTIRGQIAEDFGEITNKIGSGLGSIRDFLGSGFNKAKEGIMGSSPMDFLRGLPTPGNLLMSIASGRNPLNPKSANYNPTLQGQIDYMKDKGMYGITDQSGLNKITGGRLAGKNLVSMFGSNDLGEMYSKDLSKLQGYLATMPQRFSRLMKNNPAAYQNKIDNLNEKIAQNKREAQAAQEARQAATAARARAANPNVYANADALGFTDGRGGGFGSRSTGTNENFSNRTGRGRTGYSEGGLASMFTRRG
mgnify:CR=1 FL=1|jgi:hypothetical protein